MSLAVASQLKTADLRREKKKRERGRKRERVNEKKR